MNVAAESESLVAPRLEIKLVDAETQERIKDAAVVARWAKGRRISFEPSSKIFKKTVSKSGEDGSVILESQTSVIASQYGSVSIHIIHPLYEVISITVGKPSWDEKSMTIRRGKKLNLTIPMHKLRSKYAKKSKNEIEPRLESGWHVVVYPKNSSISTDIDDLVVGGPDRDFNYFKWAEEEKIIIDRQVIKADWVFFEHDQGVQPRLQELIDAWLR